MSWNTPKYSSSLVIHSVWSFHCIYHSFQCIWIVNSVKSQSYMTSSLTERRRMSLSCQILLDISCSHVFMGWTSWLTGHWWDENKMFQHWNDTFFAVKTRIQVFKDAFFFFFCTSDSCCLLLCWITMIPPDCWTGVSVSQRNRFTKHRGNIVELRLCTTCKDSVGHVYL